MIQDDNPIEQFRKSPSIPLHLSQTFTPDTSHTHHKTRVREVPRMDS